MGGETMRGENEQIIYLKDYAPSPYLIEHVDLDVRIAPEPRRCARNSPSCRARARPGTPLVLDGES
jgi:aminopeptidase N